MSLQGGLSIERMCQLAGVSRAGFYRHLRSRDSHDEEMHVRSEIQSIALEHEGHYGYRRVTAELRRRGMLVNHKRVARILREDALIAAPRQWPAGRWNRRDMYVNVAAGMKLTGTNQLWVADITHARLKREKRLVHRRIAHHHRQLGSKPRQRVDGAVWRRHRTDHEVRGAAGEPRCSVLRQRCASREYSVLDHAATDFVPLPQAVEGAEKEDVGANAEAIGARATVGAWTSAAQAVFPLEHARANGVPVLEEAKETVGVVGNVCSAQICRSRVACAQGATSAARRSGSGS